MRHPFSSLHFSKLRRHYQKHCDHTGSAANDIGDGLRNKHAIGSKWKTLGRRSVSRHDHHHFAEEGEKDGLHLHAFGALKWSGGGVLEGLKYKCEEVKMERRDRIFPIRAASSARHGDEKGRGSVRSGIQVLDQCVPIPETAHKEHRFPDVPRPACAVIVADHGRGSLADRDDWRFPRFLPDGIDNGIYRDHDLSAIF